MKVNSSLINTVVTIILFILNSQLVHAYFDGSTLVLHFVDSSQSVALLIHIFTETDYNVLCSCFAFYVLSEKSCIFVVQCRINFIHKIKRKFFDLLAGENKSQRRKCLFTTW